METFDELFDSFFNDNNNKKVKKRGRPKKEQSNDEKIKKIIDNLKNFSEITDVDKQYDIDNNLGDADDVYLYQEDDLYFKRSTWNVDGGDIVKLEISDIPFEDNKTLEELLDEALTNENYELAAEIRDEIKKLEKK
jgi:protein-arginine kinase activator protein McsA